jgi:AcrR family transcriptional regulator
MKESLEVAEGTRERILEAALVVLRDVGHGQFSVQKVAREAGVYQGNITYYWPRRRDLVLALAVRVVEEYRRTLLARSTSCGGGRVTRACEVLRSDDRRRGHRPRPGASGAVVDRERRPEIARLVTDDLRRVTADLIVALGVPLADPARTRSDAPCSSLGWRYRG